MTIYDKRSRIERALKAVEQGRVSIDSDKIKGTVQGSKKDTYEVNILDDTCRNGLEICRDLEFNCDPALGNVCYHILAVRILKNPLKVSII